MSRSAALFGVLGLLVSSCHATTATVPARAAPEREQPLRLESIRFYETGVAYFERAGTLAGGESTAFVVPEPHLDDALRTLVVVSNGERRPLAVEFDAVVSRDVARLRASLPADDAELGYEHALESLRNEEVEVQMGRARLVGRLLDVSEAPPVSLPGTDGAEAVPAPETMDDLYLTIARRDGAIQRLRASSVKRIRPTNPRRRALFERALGNAPSGEPVALPLRVPAASGPMRLGYVAEAPIWTPTYRLVLPESGANAMLYGSALVHNDTNEPWTSVRATFTSERPESALLELASPAYAWRARVPSPKGLSPLPQLAPVPRVDPAPPRTKPPANNASGSVGRLGSSGTHPSSALGSGSFEYPVSAPISVRAHGSALVPFLGAGVGARPVVWFGWLGGTARRAVHLVNSAAQALPSGNVAVFAASGFAGETTLPRLRPGDDAVLQFDQELDVTVEVSSKKSTSTVRAIELDGRTLDEIWRDHNEYRSVVHNAKPVAVSVYFGLGRKKDATVQGFDRLERDMPDLLVGVLEVGAKQKLERHVVVESEATQRRDPSQVSAEELREMANSELLSDEARRALRAAALVAERREAIAETLVELEERANELGIEIESARDDVEKLAYNAGIGATQLVARYLAAEREARRNDERVRALKAEDERLIERLHGELARLPKPRAPR